MSKLTNKAEDLAESLLAQQGITSLPIEPQEIALALGIEVEYKPFEDNLSGVLLRSQKKTVIAVRKRDSLNRKRFTIAHELGHYSFNHIGDVFIDHAVVNRRDTISQIAIDPQEIEANAFAAALLMPKSMILRELNALISAEQSQSLSTTQLIDELVIKFKVSKSAMTYRLINLGFIPAP